MYEISFKGQTLYYPTSSKANVSNAVLHESLDDAGYLDLTVPVTNPLYDKLKERGGRIEVLKDNTTVWWGIIRDISVDFQNNKKLYVVGELSELNDTVQPQKAYVAQTRLQIFTDILSNHNSMVETLKQFQPGYIFNDSDLEQDVVVDWEYSLDAIRNHLCREDEYVRIRREGWVRYLDIVPITNYGKRSNQYISFGDNLLDYVEEATTENIASICIPLGAPLEESSIPDYQEYLTCASANDNKIYVTNNSAVQTLGKITKVVHFDEITTAEELVTAANTWLTDAQYAKITLSLTAIDLSIIEANVDDYKVGDYVRAVCEPFGMDSWLPVRQRETDLLNLSNNKITIGSEGIKSITTQQTEKIDELQKIIPKKDSILDLAKKNVTNMLNSAGDNGHVVFKQNDDGVVYEILIMNTEDIETASKIWRWNENGFGFSNDGGTTYSVAMTMDGAIVADMITSGTMMANRIKGGTLSLGGYDNESGVLNVYGTDGESWGGAEGINLTALANKPWISAYSATIPAGTQNARYHPESSYMQNIPQGLIASCAYVYIQAEITVESFEKTGEGIPQVQLQSDFKKPNGYYYSSVESEFSVGTPLTLRLSLGDTSNLEQLRHIGIGFKNVSTSESVTVDCSLKVEDVMIYLGNNISSIQPYSEGYIYQGGSYSDFCTPELAAKLDKEGLNVYKGTVSGTNINGSNITGSTISGSTITSSGGSHSVSISGGNLNIVNDADHFLSLNQGDAALALGGKYFAAYNSSVYYGNYESIYIGKAALNAGAGSDKRLKKEIAYIPIDTSKKLINGTKPISFLYKDEKFGKRTRFGVVAQELRETIDEIGLGDCELEYERHDNYRTVEYQEFIVHLINCIKDLYSEVDLLKEEIEMLKKGVNE